jgi:hypothetical protein
MSGDVLPREAFARRVPSGWRVNWAGFPKSTPEVVAGLATAGTVWSQIAQRPNRLNPSAFAGFAVPRVVPSGTFEDRRFSSDTRAPSGLSRVVASPRIREPHRDFRGSYPSSSLLEMLANPPKSSIRKPDGRSRASIPSSGWVGVVLSPRSQGARRAHTLFGNRRTTPRAG